MNELTLTFIENRQDDLSGRADRIRSLVNVARGCIVEIGRELIDAKAECAHGQWLPWLQDEFGWGETTARKYMQVADVFGKSALSEDFRDLTIDATALYALSAPDVPQAIRDEAISRAAAGEHVTKADAEQMVAAATERAEAQLRQTIEAERERASIAIAEAIEAATGHLSQDAQALEREIERIRAEQQQPDVPQAIEMFCKILGRKKLSTNQLRLLAQVLESPISDGKRTYEPVSTSDAKQMEENLRIASAADRAIEYFAAAPAADVVLAAALPSQRDKARRLVEGAIEWLSQYRSLLNAL